MKNLDLGITDLRSSHSLAFESDISLISYQFDFEKSSYDLNICYRNSKNEKQLGESDGLRPRVSIEVYNMFSAANVVLVGFQMVSIFIDSNDIGDSLVSVLRMVLVPSPIEATLSRNQCDSILSDISYGTAMLHHVGAPVSQAIAPIIYMWRPTFRENITDLGVSDEKIMSDVELCEK
ncbi:unnamed protein product [Vicia faba]|uniref:Uncharacterized protein n=1 Tax=Vicia faba TaxID=3906 RepID=A0AAV0ZMT3_VICFA|nr:unnamed protein product [Vicia faba]